MISDRLWHWLTASATFLVVTRACTCVTLNTARERENIIQTSWVTRTGFWTRWSLVQGVFLPGWGKGRPRQEAAFLWSLKLVRSTTRRSLLEHDTIPTEEERDDENDINAFWQLLAGLAFNTYKFFFLPWLQSNKINRVDREYKKNENPRRKFEKNCVPRFMI